jgi:hypothetical protein
MIVNRVLIQETRAQNGHHSDKDASHMILILLGLPMMLFGLIFALVHLSHRQRTVCRDVITPATAVEAKDVSVVGIVQPLEKTDKSPVSGDEVVWLRAFKTFQGFFRSSGGSASHVRRIGKHNSRFALVDEFNPDKQVVIDGKRISETWILLENRRYRLDGTPLKSTDESPGALQGLISLLRFHLLERQGVEERAIRPGDRLWAHGRIRQRDSELVLYGFSAWLDDRPPTERGAHAADHARLGGVLGGSGALMTLIGWLLT